MGQSSYVNPVRVPPKPQARPKSPVAAPGQGVDWILIGVVTAMTLFGLLMVYSAGPKFAMAIGSPPDYFLKRQVLWALISLVVAGVLSRVNYHFFRRVTVLLMVITLVALIAVAILADTTLGANRSILSGSIRPSELAKLVGILYISVWLASKQEVLNDMTLGLFPLILILGVTGGLIFIQPDISAAITVIMLGGILFFLAGGEWRQIGISLAVTCLVVWVVVNVMPTGVRRTTEYLAGLQNPLNASYHVQRSLESVINGGIFGVGIGHGSTKFTGLPVAPTDSIFAVIAEETGLIGAGVIILAYLVILWRGLQIARRAPDPLGMLLASGLSIWIVIEALLNMAVMVNLLPQAGNALPFISYGGSNLVVTLAAVGILLNIARSSGQANAKAGGNTFGAVVDLRWRDRRRRVPRYGRSSGTKQ